MRPQRETGSTPRRIWRAGAAAACLAAVLGVASMQAAPDDGAAQDSRDGVSLYRTYCASCHGVSGRGDGAIGPYLRRPPANLTQIARANRGVFPAERVAQIIDGRQSVRTHGTSDMPVWGLVFGRSTMVASEAEVDARIHALVEYLASIQERPGE